VRVKTACLLLLVALRIGAAGAQQPDETPASPQQSFAELFDAVQTAHLFQDSKVFPDAVPRESPEIILRKYRTRPPNAGQPLKQFVLEHFTLPTLGATAPSPADRVSIAEHIDSLWNALTRSTPNAPPYSSLLPLPKSYVVPGGRFREMYYWDSYFTMLGLAQSGRQDLLGGMVDDFAAMIDRYGHVPNGARSYYLSRSQPPFFFAMVKLTNPRDPAAAYARYLPQLRREYAFWMEGDSLLPVGAAHRRVMRLRENVFLNRYWDDEDTPRDESYREDVKLARRSHRNAKDLYRDVRAAAESGWDFSSRWFADGRSPASIETTQILPVDLNSLMFGLEQAIVEGCGRAGDLACATEFTRRSKSRMRGLFEFFWDEPSGEFQDYRWSDGKRTGRSSAAMLYPLFVGAASALQMKRVAAAVRGKLLREGGLVSTPANTGQQWDAPNGWAPLPWIAVSGLRDAGELPLAESIACRWMATVNDVYQREGKLVEKYDVENADKHGGGGEYPLQDGFGWTNGVMRQLMALYPGC
jgi:alpha,alpha-trehalase